MLYWVNNYLTFLFMLFRCGRMRGGLLGCGVFIGCSAYLVGCRSNINII
ncbi:MAG: hypothetical protein ACK5YA_00575 [bacterium]